MMMFEDHLRRIALGTLVAAAVGLGAAPDALVAQEGTPTRVVVRAVAGDAKIIGDGVGGAMITVVDAETGQVLAEGRQTGSTGDTRRIMSMPRERGMTVYDTEGAAEYVAELMLSEPTAVVVSAKGPMGIPHAIRTASAEMLLVPGGHVEGEGIVLTLHGFAVEILEPAPMAPAAGSLDVRARIRMMCGCPLTPGGMWDSDPVDIRARLVSGGEVLSEAALRYAGQPSTFEGTLEVPASAAGRDVELEVVASDPARTNFGRHAVPVGSTR